MNLSKRGKWLAGIAALIAAYVLFGPSDPDSVEPAKASVRPVAHESRPAATVSMPVARSLFLLAHRVVEARSAGSLFAAHSWYVAPPPPPPPVEVPTAPEPPPAPTAPPLPFSYIGTYAPDGEKAVYFLTQGDRVYDVHIGDTIDNTYSVDSFNNGQLVLTYKPLNIQQQLTAGTPQ